MASTPVRGRVPRAQGEQARPAARRLPGAVCSFHKYTEGRGGSGAPCPGVIPALLELGTREGPFCSVSREEVTFKESLAASTPLPCPLETLCSFKSQDVYGLVKLYDKTLPAAAPALRAFRGASSG